MDALSELARMTRHALEEGLDMPYIREFNVSSTRRLYEVYSKEDGIFRGYYTTNIDKFESKSWSLQTHDFQLVDIATEKANK